mmetsp:Transcript_634/g.811  ORF Transcript_634/g.811 Transcript_634/m.811 type:complete len:175 (+) Transcript_634:57-581(+)
MALRVLVSRGVREPLWQKSLSQNMKLALGTHTAITKTNGISDRQNISLKGRRNFATANFNQIPQNQMIKISEWTNRFKHLVSTYGPLALGFHFGVEAIVLGGFYWGVSNGLIDIKSLLDHFQSVTGTNVPIPGTASNILVSYILTTSLTGFPRTILTVVATPWLARRFGWTTKG